MRVLILTAMYPTPDNPAFGSFVKTQYESLKAIGVDAQLLILKGRQRKLIYPKGIFQLRRELAHRTIDVVHAHYSYVGMVARSQWQVPIIVTYHGDDLLGTINERGQHTIASKIIASAGRTLSRFVDAVIVQSKQMADKIQGSSNVHVIPHEVDLEIFRPTDRIVARAVLGLDPKRKYLLFAANPQIPVKRFPLAKAAVDQLRQHDPAVELLIVHREAQPRLALYMSACDALVFPSYQEGSPNVVKQAMACNLPVVATDVGDVAEIVARTEGCYVCPATVEEFAGKLRQVLIHCARTTGRADIAHLAGPLVARQLLQVYDETINKRVLASERASVL
jgi:glycosyltransferase involved in cell wall biosynthesis